MIKAICLFITVHILSIFHCYIYSEGVFPSDECIHLQCNSFKYIFASCKPSPSTLYSLFTQSLYNFITHRTNSQECIHINLKSIQVFNLHDPYSKKQFLCILTYPNLFHFINDFSKGNNIFFTFSFGLLPFSLSPERHLTGTFLSMPNFRPIF